MKTLTLIVLLASVSYADQAADAFGTEFARSLQRVLERQQKQQEDYMPVETSNVYPQGHYDVRDNYGQLGQKEFATYSQCQSSLDNSQMYKDCVWVEK